ncbi:toll-like receptor 4, partial [Patella vulgata]|uniref:toll-like receptor 4 n=1 Tax=Patella vulgata TaxID=6465 RepID=UPI0024A845B6
ISGVETIKHLNLSNNFCNEIYPGFFCEFKSLETLDLHNNYLESAICSDTNGTLFSKLTQLKEINLSYNKIWFIPKSLFRGLIKCEKIDLSHNNLLSKDFIFTIRHMVNLTYIDFETNGLRFINESMQRELEISGNLTVDFSDNRFYCICDSLSFLHWMFSTRRLNFNNFDNYECDFTNGTIVTFANKELIFNELNIKCRKALWFFFGALGGTLILVVIIIGAITYRFRWKLRYLYYSATRSNKIHHGNDSFEYDAFISYSEDARLFVDQTMRFKVEEEAGLRLCLHKRDFLPSLPIAEGIVTAVKTSRKTILVMSPDFIKSYWCLYEMNMADMESQHTGRDMLLILFYKHIKYDKIPSTVMYQIKSHTYIEYPNEDNDSGEMDIFWNNFKIAIEC